MTKVMCKMDEDEKNIFFDCMNHAGDRHVCGMCSVLCKTLIDASYRAEDYRGATVSDEDDSKGHVHFTVSNVDDILIGVFTSVMEVFKEIAEEFPDNCKVY